MPELLITQSSGTEEHCWRFQATTSSLILTTYTHTRKRTENGLTWRQRLSSVIGTLDPTTMAPRPGRWVIRGRDLRLDLLTPQTLRDVRQKLVGVVA